MFKDLAELRVRSYMIEVWLWEEEENEENTVSGKEWEAQVLRDANSVVAEVE